MKISLARGPRGPLSRETAWGCLTSNLALPGSGSLVAGRVSGYGQLLLTIAGFALTSIFGVRFVFWGFSNWSRLHGPGVDPYEALAEWWVQVRWALLGLGVFVAALLWAFCSSLAILASARKAEPHKQPPPLT